MIVANHDARVGDLRGQSLRPVAEIHAMNARRWPNLRGRPAEPRPLGVATRQTQRSDFAGGCLHAAAGPGASFSRLAARDAPPGRLRAQHPAVGPDGAWCVGELTGFPLPIGGARIYRVVPGQAPVIFTDSFNNSIDMAFDEDGNLLVLEIAKSSLLSLFMWTVTPHVRIRPTAHGCLT